MAEQTELRGIVRIADKDIAGTTPIQHALTKSKGISFMMANAICVALKLDPARQAGYFTQEELEHIEDCMKNPAKYSIPSWLFNRRKDMETGEDKHLVSVDLTLTQKSDIRFMQKIKSYKGVRHSMGSKKVRGQRTQSTGRKKKGSLGVKRRVDAKAGK